MKVRQHKHRVVQLGVPWGSYLTSWDKAIPPVTKETGIPSESLVPACRAAAPQGPRQFALL